MKENVTELISEENLKKKVKELAQQIMKDYEGKTIHLIGILRGSVVFMVDLAREIKQDVLFDFMDVSSYGDGTESSGSIKIIKDLDEPLTGKDVLIVEERKRMALVHDLRAEQRQKFPVKICFPEMFLLFAQLGKVHLFVTGVRQLPDQVLKIFVALGLQFGDAGRDGRDLFGSRHVGDHIRLVVLEQGLVIQRADADHKELVHIAAEDRRKFQAFPQRHILFLGQRQYAAVEIEPAQFSIDENTFGLLLFQILFLPVILCPGIPACRLWPAPPSFRSCGPIFPSLHPVLPAKQRGRVLPGRQ